MPCAAAISIKSASCGHNPLSSGWTFTTSLQSAGACAAKDGTTVSIRDRMDLIGECTSTCLSQLICSSRTKNGLPESNSFCSAALAQRNRNGRPSTRGIQEVASPSAQDWRKRKKNKKNRQNR